MTMRLVSMLALLGLIMLLANRAADPTSWAWFESDAPAATDSQAAKSASADAAVAKAAGSPARTVESTPRETVERGPTDTDPEELAGFVEEAQAIEDRSLYNRPEEMPAYWRMFGWVQRQSFAVLQERGSKHSVFNDFVQSPDASRGRIVQLDMYVRQVFKRDAPENSTGVKHVYELVGPSDESKTWPYRIITPELPPGMPVGSDVHERVKFAGYFFKLQTYHAVGSGPKDRPLPIPVLMGRLSWRPSPLATATKPKSDFALLSQLAQQGWIWWLGVAALALGGLRIGMWLYGRNRGAQREKLQSLEAHPEHDPDRLKQFLQETEEGTEIDDAPRKTLYNEERFGYDNFEIKRNGKDPRYKP